MLNISNRDRMVQAMKDARLLIEYRAVYYNLQNDEEVMELLARLEKFQLELQMKSHEDVLKLLNSNVVKEDEIETMVFN